MGLTLPKPNRFGTFVVRQSQNKFTYWRDTGRVVTDGDMDRFDADALRDYRTVKDEFDPLILQRNPVTCRMCDQDFITRESGVKHVMSEHRSELDHKQQLLEEAMSAASSGAVPTAASNRSLIDQMKEWGWQYKKGKGDWEVWKSPDGNVTVEVRPATQHSGTPAKTIKEIIEATHVDADTFWIGVDDRPDQTEKDKKVSRTSGVSRRVLAVLKQHANAHLDVPTITGMIGGDLSQEQVQGACSYLVGKGLIIAPLRGIYTFDTDDVEHKVGIDISVDRPAVAAPAPQPAPQPAQEAPERPAVQPTPIRTEPAAPLRKKPPAVTQEDIDRTVDPEEINDVLDMLFPNGFKARHLPAIDHWREATKALIASIRAD